MFRLLDHYWTPVRITWLVSILVVATITVPGREYGLPYVAAASGILAALTIVSMAIHVLLAPYRIIRARKRNLAFESGLALDVKWLWLACACGAGCLALASDGLAARTAYACFLAACILQRHRRLATLLATATTLMVLVLRIRIAPDLALADLSVFNQTLEAITVLVIGGVLLQGTRRAQQGRAAFSGVTFSLCTLAMLFVQAPRAYINATFSSTVAGQTITQQHPRQMMPVRYYDLFVTPGGARLVYSLWGQSVLGYVSLTDTTTYYQELPGDGTALQRFASGTTDPQRIQHNLGATRIDQRPFQTTFCDIGYAIGFGHSVTLGWSVAVQEWLPRVLVWDPQTCRPEKFEIPQNAPYGIICDGNDRCYLNGWFLSDTLTELVLNHDRPTLESRRSIPIGPFAAGMALDTSAQRLYVARPVAGTIDLIDLESFQRVGRIKTATMVRNIALAPEHNLLFAAEYGGTIQIHDSRTGKPLGVVTGGREIRDIVWSPARQTLYWASFEAIYYLHKKGIDTRISPAGVLSH